MGVEGESPGSPPGPANAKASFSAKGGSNLKDRATDTVTMKVTRVDKEMAVSKQRDVSNLSSASAPPQANRPRPQGVRISREGVVKRNHSPTSPGTDDAPPAMKRQNSVGTPSWKTADAGCQTDFIIDYVKPIPSTGNDWKRVIEPSLESAFKNTKDLRESLVSVGSFTEELAEALDKAGIEVDEAGLLMIVEKSEEDLVKAGFKMVHARKLKQIVSKYRIVEQNPEQPGARAMSSDDNSAGMRSSGGQRGVVSEGDVRL